MQQKGENFDDNSTILRDDENTNQEKVNEPHNNLCLRSGIKSSLRKKASTKVETKTGNLFANNTTISM